jgi:hypothetical protein
MLPQELDVAVNGKMSWNFRTMTCFSIISSHINVLPVYNPSVAYEREMAG